MNLPPLLAELHRAIAEDLDKARRHAASGAPGCRDARRRMVRLRADMIRLEIGEPVR